MSSNMNTTGIINLKGSIELFSFSAKHIAIYILSVPDDFSPVRKREDHFVSSDSEEKTSLLLIDQSATDLI